MNYNILYFNSIKVRLEPGGSSYAARKQLHFNSIKVRLELKSLITLTERVPFQFHKGTIRTIATRSETPTLQYFNSIKVRLER